MTNQSKINALFTAIACIIDMKVDKNNLVEFELISSLKELLNDPMFDSIKQEGFEKNLYAISKGGNLFPTPKGFDMLFAQPQQKVITQKVTKPVERLTDTEVINTFVECGKQLCNRIPNGKVLQGKIVDNYETIYDTCACVVDNVNSLVTVTVEEA